MPHGLTESAGVQYAVICWSPCAQRWFYPKGRCTSRPSVTSCLSEKKNLPPHPPPHSLACLSSLSSLASFFSLSALRSLPFLLSLPQICTFLSSSLSPRFPLMSICVLAFVYPLKFVWVPRDILDYGGLGRDSCTRCPMLCAVVTALARFWQSRHQIRVLAL